MLASYGRRIERAGFKLLLVFPYAFVDTSQAWMEPRRRRIAVSAAGPAADLALGAVFALACLVAPPGAQRDVLFQLAFAAYVGACFNLNPFLDRDGYQILVDVLREPNLRRRAREQFARRLAGQPDAGDSRLLARYSVLALAWSVVAVGFAVAMTLRYRTTLAAVAPADWLAWLALGAVWLIVLVPTAVLLAGPLASGERAHDAAQRRGGAADRAARPSRAFRRPRSAPGRGCGAGTTRPNGSTACAVRAVAAIQPADAAAARRIHLGQLDGLVVQPLQRA